MPRPLLSDSWSTGQMRRRPRKEAARASTHRLTWPFETCGSAKAREQRTWTHSIRYEQQTLRWQTHCQQRHETPERMWMASSPRSRPNPLERASRRAESTHRGQARAGKNQAGDPASRKQGGNSLREATSGQRSSYYLITTRREQLCRGKRIFVKSHRYRRRRRRPSAAAGRRGGFFNFQFSPK